jgi:XTP/dITP diphosphohydrolase/tetrapyrrole methylase family protein/MazG family protein
MREELGDVLIQVVFHAQLATEQGKFNFEDVARDINDKLIRRHPHVFGVNKVDTTAQVMEVWEKVKAGEKAASGKTESTLFKQLPPRLPALMFAEEVAKRIEKKQLPADGIIDLAQVKSLGAHLDEATLGRMLFEITAAARVKGLDPEGALRKESDRVMREVEARFAAVAH